MLATSADVAIDTGPRTVTGLFTGWTFDSSTNISITCAFSRYVRRSAGHRDARLRWENVRIHTTASARLLPELRTREFFQAKCLNLDLPPCLQLATGVVNVLAVDVGSR